MMDRRSESEIWISSYDTPFTDDDLVLPMTGERRYPTTEEFRETVERIVDEPVRFVETGYGCSCHVTGVDDAGGTSFAAIDVDRRVPQVYFDAAAARGRDAVARTRRRASVAYVIESLLEDSERVADYVAAHRVSHAPQVVPDGGTCVETTTRGGRHDDDVAWLREAVFSRCQYLHGGQREAGRPDRDGRLTDLLGAFERDPLSNDKLGQQFGWRAATRPSRGPDLALELLLVESHAQVVSALGGETS